MISIKGLTVKYETSGGIVTALSDIDMSIADGDIVAIIGPSGCGKSTLLHVLAGIIGDYEGQVLIKGQPVNPREQRIGLILQDYGLLPWKTVYENAVLGLKIKGEVIDQVYAEYILKRLGLADMASRYPNQLSGGQRQRVAIARSFILKPDLLLMDEPFSALDEITRESMQDLFLDIWRQYKVSTLFVTHSIEEAIYVGHRIVVLTPSPGRIQDRIDNPLFGMDDLRLSDDFYHINMQIRRMLKEDGAHFYEA
ncbi:ABC transporter ATP-binding protein [Mahella sp.]|uniref:ABC transporter ATP-binding protein n=1 Tax=Mahella sp. TaxID=2798721 RepID=UPI0025B84E1F|nr:ABC transporter ATP-binding protein [Mahella sp.]MBZ4665690.1 transporter related protein [Mahella sp.]MDK2903067.1 NitT/TauT family transport system ATP-binding protein [Clostridiales bacterium]